MALPKNVNRLITQRNDLIDNTITDFEDKQADIDKAIFNRLLVILKDLDTDKDGRIKPIAKNIKLANKIKALKPQILTQRYINDVHKFVDGFDDVAVITDKYFDKYGKS